MNEKPRRKSKAPGRYYRVGISLPELFEMFPTEAKATAWFERERWGTTGMYCPRCAGRCRSGAEIAETISASGRTP